MAAAAGAIGGGLLSAVGQWSANSTNKQLNRENRDWMERMSNTAWQRAVNDMRTAGLNPNLAFSQGPASTPSNSAATVRPTLTEIGRGVSSAAAVQQAYKQGNANIDLTKAQAYKATQEGNSAAVIAKEQETTTNLQQSEMNRRIDEAITRANLNEAQKKQIEEMLPLLKAASKAGTDLNLANITSAEIAQKLEKLKVPEAETTARWFESMLGGGGRVSNALKDILQIINMLRGGK